MANAHEMWANCIVRICLYADADILFINYLKNCNVWWKM